MIPSRLLRRPRVLIVGCGDVGMRTIPLLSPRFRVLALSRSAGRDAGVRAAGGQPVRGDLDDARHLRRAAALACGAFGVLHFAPPQAQGIVDRRTQAFIAALGRVRSRQAAWPAWAGKRSRGGRTGTPDQAPILTDSRALPLVYASTTGVYGDCGGALIDETHRVAPANARAIRRVSAERQLRDACLRGNMSPSILRIPGIYARTRLPEARLHRGTPALRPEDDVYTSHIHADDLAAIAVRTLWRGRSQRLYHACDDSRLRMGTYFAMVADALGLPHPPEIARSEAERVIEPMLMSFMRESRQLCNRRLKQELAFTLLYPTVAAFLATLPPSLNASGVAAAEQPPHPGAGRMSQAGVLN